MYNRYGQCPRAKRKRMLEYKFRVTTQEGRKNKMRIVTVYAPSFGEARELVGPGAVRKIR